MAREFKGKAGTIHFEYDKENKRFQVWFEDFCIIGLGDTEIEALKDAVKYGVEISELAASAIGELELNGAGQ